MIDTAAPAASLVRQFIVAVATQACRVCPGGQRVAFSLRDPLDFNGLVIVFSHHGQNREVRVEIPEFKLHDQESFWRAIKDQIPRPVFSRGWSRCSLVRPIVLGQPRQFHFE